MRPEAEETVGGAASPQVRNSLKEQRHLQKSGEFMEVSDPQSLQAKARDGGPNEEVDNGLKAGVGGNNNHLL